MRNVINLNTGWRFCHENIGLPATFPENWETVNLPHTWNAVDGHDGNGSYDKGTYWYARKFTTPRQPLPGGRVFVEFQGAALMATVYVNGVKVAYHEGGFSTFRADITEVCKDGEDNLLAVACSNEFKDSVYPQNADFTFYGGLYRGVNLISVPDAHFDLEYYGGPGIMVTPKPCGEDALFEIETWVKNFDENFTIQYSICDEEGEEVAYGVRPADSTKTVLCVPDAKLWSMNWPSSCSLLVLLQPTIWTAVVPPPCILTEKSSTIPRPMATPSKKGASATLFISDTDHTERPAGVAFAYLVVSIGCALFGAVYELFSHGVYSFYMLYAFAFPLIGGSLPFLTLSLFFEKKQTVKLPGMPYHCGIATLTVGCILCGVLEIYGTANVMTCWYWVVGCVLCVAEILNSVAGNIRR